MVIFITFGVPELLVNIWGSIEKGLLGVGHADIQSSTTHYHLSSGVP